MNFERKYLSFGVMVCSGVVMLVTFSAPAQNLFVSGLEGSILELTPGGVESTTATGLNGADGLAFQGVTLPVPEPSALGLLAVGAAAFFVRRRHRI